MGSSFGAGAGADMLQDILRRKFTEAVANQRTQQDQQRINIDRAEMLQRAAAQAQQMRSLQEARDAAAQGQATTKALRLASVLKPGAALDAPAVDALSAGDMGDLVEHKDATLGSRNISGMVQAGKAPRILGLASTANPGQAAKDTFTGTASQLQAEEDRKARAAERDAARIERDEARGEAQKGREELIRLTASLRPQPQAGQRGLSPTAEANLTTKLAGDWQKVSAPAREMDRQFNLMQTGLQRFREGDKNGGAQAVLVTFQKILDPTSVVRESEYARSAEGVSLLQRMQGYAEKLKSGGAGVPEAALQEMVKTAAAFTANSRNSAEGQRKRLGAFADKYGVPHELVFDDGGGPSAAPAAGKPGGGDPLGIR